MNRPLARIIAFVPAVVAAGLLTWAGLSLGDVPSLPVLVVAVGAVGAMLLWPSEVPARAGWAMTVAALAAASTAAAEAILLLALCRLVLLLVRGRPPGGLFGAAADFGGTVVAGSVGLVTLALVPVPMSVTAAATGLVFVALDRVVTVLPARLVIDGKMPTVAALFPPGQLVKGAVGVGAGVALGAAALAGPVETLVAAAGLGMLPQMAYRPVSDDAANPLVQFAATVSSMDHYQQVLDAASTTAADLLDCPADVRLGGLPDESLGEVGVILVRHYWLVASPSHRGPDWRDNAQKTLEAIVTISRPAFDRLAQTADLHEQVHTDSLTGALNKAGLQAELQAALLSAERVAVLFIDLDKFKPVNDTHGHAAGDEILRDVTKRLSALKRGHDSVARYGGDEFVVVLRQVAEKADVSSIGERILEQMRQPFPITNPKFGTSPDEPPSIFVTIGASVGIALNQPGDTSDSIMERSDEAMYQAKNGGRGRLVMSG